MYLDPIHNWTVPVCTAYGGNYLCPRLPETADGWALVLIETSPQQIEAAKQDPRVVYCGKDYNTPPPQVLTTYASWLDPAVNYMFMGQVLAKLAETEPIFGQDQ
jgi:hypothetical protein